MKILKEIDKKRGDIHTDSYTSTWRELISQYKEGEIIIDPDFQRLFRWTLDMQSKFIESLVLDIPVPAIFLYQNDEAKFEVIDGLQRFCTLLKFFAPETSKKLQSGTGSKKDINNINVSSVLTEGSMIKSLKGYTYETLPDKLLRTIKAARVSVMLLEQDSSKEAKYEVFKRLNKYGVKLSFQEIRNVTGRLYDKKFPTDLKKFALLKDVKESLSFKNEKEQKMDVEELILRFLAFNFGFNMYVHLIDEFLDDFMIHASERKYNFNDDVQARLKETFKLINKSVRNGGAFKYLKNGKFQGQFSSNLFDIVVSGVYKNLEKLTPKKLNIKLIEMHKDDSFRAYTGSGSNTKVKISSRVKYGKSFLK